MEDVLPQGLVVLALAAAGSGLAVVVVAALWFRRLRASVALALQGIVAQNLQQIHEINERMTALQNQQRQHEQQVLNLAQGNMRLRQDLTTLARYIDSDHSNGPAAERLVH